MSLAFNSIGTRALPQDILWDGSRRIAYVIGPTNGAHDPGVSNALYYIDTFDFTTGSPVLRGSVTFQSTNTSPGLAVTPYWTGVTAQNPMPWHYNCLDASGRIWTVAFFFIPGISTQFGSPELEVMFLFTTDPTTGISTQQLTSYQNPGQTQAEVEVPFGIYSFMAGGVNYLWTILTVEDFASSTLREFVLVVDPASPSYTESGPALNPNREYSAPIFDGIQYAYLLENGQDYDGSGNAPDDGSFNILQYRVLGGSASLVGTFAISNGGLGRAFWGLINPSSGNLYLYTSAGAVQIFDPTSESIVSTTDAGVFSGLGTDNRNEPYQNSYALLTAGNTTAFQMGQVDLDNCVLFGLSPAGQVVGGSGIYDGLTFSGIRRLNLDNLTTLDDHYPQNEWLDGSTDPSDMANNGTGMAAVYAPELNSLLWTTYIRTNPDLSGNTFYQLIWPGVGDCAGGGGVAPPIGNPFLSGCS